MPVEITGYPEKATTAFVVGSGPSVPIRWTRWGAETHDEFHQRVLEEATRLGLGAVHFGTWKGAA